MLQKALQCVGLAKTPAPAPVPTYTGPDHTAGLALDLLKLILGALPPRSLAICLCVNRKWNEAASDDRLWALACRHLYPVSTKRADQSFKDYYATCQYGARTLTGNCWKSKGIFDLENSSSAGLRVSGEYLFVAAVSFVERIELANPENRVPLKGQDGSVTCMHVHCDLLVTGVDNGQLCAWNAVDTSLTGKWKAHDGSVRCVQVAENGIFSGSLDCSAKQWSPEGTLIQTFLHESGPVTCLQMSNDRLYTGTTGGVCEWGLESGKLLRRFSAPWPKPVIALQVTADRLYIGQGPTVQVSDLNTGKTLKRVSEPKQMLSCMQVVGRFVFFGACYGDLQVMDTLSGQRLQFLTIWPIGVSYLQVVADRIFYGDTSGRVNVAEIVPRGQLGIIDHKLGPTNLLAPEDSPLVIDWLRGV